MKIISPTLIFVLLIKAAFSVEVEADKQRIIELVKVSITHNSIRSDYPLTFIQYSSALDTWILSFESGKPDSGYSIYIKDMNAQFFELQWAGMTWKKRYATSR
jgi:hypothetical protein